MTKYKQVEPRTTPKPQKQAKSVETKEDLSEDDDLVVMYNQPHLRKGVRVDDEIAPKVVPVVGGPEEIVVDDTEEVYIGDDNEVIPAFGNFEEDSDVSENNTLEYSGEAAGEASVLEDAFVPREAHAEIGHETDEAVEEFSEGHGNGDDSDTDSDSDTSSIALRKSSRNRSATKIFTYHKIGGQPTIDEVNGNKEK